MKMFSVSTALAGIIVVLAPPGFPQPTSPAAAVQKSASGSTRGAGAAAMKSTGSAVLTNRDIIRMVQARVYDDVILSKIKSSKTSFDTSVDGLIALRRAGSSDAVMAAMMGPGATLPVPAAATSQADSIPAAPPAMSPESSPAEIQTGSVSSGAETDAASPVRFAPKILLPAKQADPSHAPQNYGVYIQVNGELRLLGRTQTKVQINKFRAIVKNRIPFTREKIDINIPGAHSTSRYPVLRPNFYAYLPPSRDVSKFRLMKAKVTGPKVDQRTVANASILFSTEQDQDEVLCDIGPTGVKDLYRISPREDLFSGEFGFVEGNAGDASTPGLQIIDVWDFAIDRKEDKLSLAEYLSTLAGPGLSDSAFLEWTKADCQKIIDDREGKLDLTGSLTAWLRQQNKTLDVYWADRQFAQAFARIEMLDKDLTQEQARKLAGLLIPANEGQFYVMVSVGARIGSRKLDGADEGERAVRPFDAALTNDKGKDVVPASRLEFIGGYAGLWKSTFDQKDIRGQILTPTTDELDFEARLNESLDFKAKFPLSWVAAEK